MKVNNIMIKNLENEIKTIRKNFIDELLSVLRKCPDADEYTKNYPELREYLIEISEKKDGLLDNLICALEYYLEK